MQRGFASATVLVIDNCDRSRKVRVRALDQESFHTLEARDGPEALAIVRRDGPDLIVSDLTTQAMDVVQLCAAIRGGDNVVTTPILLISGGPPPPPTLVVALEAGADDYLVEPVDSALLVAKVRALLARRCSRSSSRV